MIIKFKRNYKKSLSFWFYAPIIATSDSVSIVGKVCIYSNKNYVKTNENNFKN